MAWLKIDDRMHSHRKTRALLRAGGDKRRDAAPMGLWLLAGAWAAQNNGSGWVPSEELDRFDDGWEDLAERLVAAGYWWPEEREDEPGFGFVNWEKYNPTPQSSAASGAFGNHKRWHEARKIVSEDCEFCPKEPDFAPDIAPEDDGASPSIAPRIAPISPPDREANRESSHTPGPNPTRPDPIPLLSESDDSDEFDDTGSTPKPNTEAEFDQWYAGYPRKEGKGQARKAYKAARKKADQQTLIAGVARLVAQRLERQFTPLPATWLNGERWLDEVATPTEPAADDEWGPRKPDVFSIYDGDEESYLLHLERGGWTREQGRWTE